MSSLFFVAVLSAALLCRNVSSFSFSVPLSESVSISGRHSCGSMVVEGTLRIESGTYLAADRIEVASTGSLIVGTASSPASDVTIFLQHAAGQKNVDTPYGKLLSYGVTSMLGAAKTSWTLLNEDCDGCSVLSVDECSGWSVGDRLAVTTTGNGATSFGAVIESADNFKSEQRSIVSLNGCRVTLDAALSYHHRGRWLDGVVPTQSEVLNLDRSILITGPGPFWYDDADSAEGFQCLKH